MLVIDVLCLLWLYFFPSLLAYYEEHPCKQRILWTNILSAWTIVGWIVCVAWALTSERKWSLLSGRR